MLLSPIAPSANLTAYTHAHPLPTASALSRCLCMAVLSTPPSSPESCTADAPFLAPRRSHRRDPMHRLTSRSMHHNSSTPDDPTFVSLIPKNDQNNHSPKASRSILRSPRHAIHTFFLSRPLLFSILFFLCLSVGFILYIFRNPLQVAYLRWNAVPPGLWSKNGMLYVGKDTPFFIKGFSWYGMEEPAHVPGGTGIISMPTVFKFAQRHNFNAIRIPLSVENILDNDTPRTGIAPFKNPHFSGLPYLDVLMAIIRTAASNNILIMLDIHRLKSKDVQSTGYWHSENMSEQRLFRVWDTLCNKFAEEWNVLGADLFNEPYEALWNSSDKTKDWQFAAEQLGNRVHNKCPSWLIVIEGVGETAGGPKTNVFWSENLNVMKASPPRLTLRNKVALSPHVYGPAVYMQNYFKSSNFTQDMPALWDDHFGAVNRATGLAIIIGEWGGTFVGKDKEWQLKFMQYLIDKKFGFFYWCLNPESSDTGGLLKEGWRVPEEKKLTMLDRAPSTSVTDHAIHFMHWRNWRT